MGYGDNEPPAIRADAMPATLSQQNHFHILILTFIAWDVIKFHWVLHGGAPGDLEVASGKLATDFNLPAHSGGMYTVTAQGCSKALDGSTSYCSPISPPLDVVAAVNTTSVRQFLLSSGIDPSTGMQAHLPPDTVYPVSLTALMGL